MVIKLYLLWSPYHFSGQTLGITIVYAAKAGFVIDGWLRRSLTAFIFLTFLVQNALGGSRSSRQPVLRRRLPDAGRARLAAADVDEVDVGRARSHDRHADLADCRTDGPRVPWIVLLPAFRAVRLVHRYPRGHSPTWCPFFHSLQYLLIAWNVQLKDGLAERKRDPSLAIRVVRVDAVDGDQHCRRLRPLLGASPSRQPLRQVDGVQHRRDARRDPDPSLLRRRSHLEIAQPCSEITTVVVAPSGERPTMKHAMLSAARPTGCLVGV